MESIDSDMFLQMLSAVDQNEYASTIQPLDHDKPVFYWIFKSSDFIN
jgi:hypothetical protein